MKLLLSKKDKDWIKFFTPITSTAIFTMLVVGNVISIEPIMDEIFPNFNMAIAFGPEDPTCIELGTCDLFQNPFDTMIEPYKVAIGDLALVVIWAIIMAILWLRVSNTMVVGVVGVLLAGVFTQGFSPEAQAIGWALLAIAVAVAVYQIIVVRTHFPTN